MTDAYPPTIPILGPLEPGKTQGHRVTLPGAALVDEARPVTTITGAKPGPVLFVGAGVHGAEYPAVEAVIRLGTELNAAEIAGTVVLMPVLNLPAFWQRSAFVCPVDNVNPNRVFPGDPHGTYSEQMAHALLNEFIVHADAYIDLHGGDIPETLVPLTICRKGNEPVDAQATELARVFGLPYILTEDWSSKQELGLSSYAAAAKHGIPAVICEAGGSGQMQLDAVDVLMDGVSRVLAHLSMMAKTVPDASPPAVLTSFAWLRAQHAGMFYPSVATNDEVRRGEAIGRIGSLFGDTLETIVSPVTGRVLFLTTNPAVVANGLLIGIGVPD